MMEHNGDKEPYTPFFQFFRGTKDQDHNVDPNQKRETHG